MPQVLIVNPSPRPSQRKGAAKKAAKQGAVKMAARKKPRTAAQKRATAKLVALNKARRSGKSSSRPARKRTRKVRRSNPVETIMSNPKRRRRASPKRRRSSKAAATGAGRVLRYRRRNPIGGGLGGFITGQLVPSAIGGGGALLLDVALAMLPIPATLKVGAMAPVVRIAGAVGIGALARMVTNRRTADQIAAGALTVTMYQITRQVLARMLPAGSVPGLSAPDDYGVGYINSGMMVGDDGMGEYVSDVPLQLADQSPLGEYVSGDDGMAGEYDGVSGWETGVYR